MLSYKGVWLERNYCFLMVWEKCLDFLVVNKIMFVCLISVFSVFLVLKGFFFKFFKESLKVFLFILIKDMWLIIYFYYFIKMIL